MLASLEGHTMLVPAVWSLEIANAVLVGERRKRASQPEIRQFTTLLDLELSIRHGAPLATLDEKLQKAAQLAGVSITTGRERRTRIAAVLSYFGCARRLAQC